MRDVRPIYRYEMPPAVSSMAVHRIEEVRYQFYMQQRIPYLTKLRRWIRRGGRGRRGRLSEFEASDIFEREIKYLLTKECNSIFLRTFYLSKFCEPFG